MHTSELTVISSKTKITGTLEVRNELHFFGQLFGEIHGQAGSIIFLKEGSLLEGKITGETIIIAGFVKGDIRSTKKVWITPHGKLVGSVQSPSLQVDPGALFEATVTRNH